VASDPRLYRPSIGIGRSRRAASAGALVDLTGTSGSTPARTIMRSPFGFSQTSCLCRVLPTLSQPHWDARQTTAGLNISTGPDGLRFMINLPARREHLVFGPKAAIAGLNQRGVSQALTETALPPFKSERSRRRNRQSELVTSRRRPRRLSFYVHGPVVKLR